MGEILQFVQLGGQAGLQGPKHGVGIPVEGVEGLYLHVFHIDPQCIQGLHSTLRISGTGNLSNDHPCDAFTV